jgi:hypothetical protein
MRKRTGFCFIGNLSGSVCSFAHPFLSRGGWPKQVVNTRERLAREDDITNPSAWRASALRNRFRAFSTAPLRAVCQLPLGGAFAGVMVLLSVSIRWMAPRDGGKVRLADIAE